MKVKVLQKPYYYGRRQHEVGEICEVDDREAMNVDILCRLGLLERVKEDATSYRTRVLKVEKPLETEPAVPPKQAEGRDSGGQPIEPMTTENVPLTPSRRVYRRRDMKVEDSKE